MNITKQCRDIKQLSAQAQKACALFIEECKKQGLNVLITETYRSQERQNYLYEQGRTRPGQIVTWTRNSNHTGRKAWDICKNVKGHEYDDHTFFRKCGDIAKELGITLGGTWSTPDTPHFEIKLDWKESITKEDEELKKAVTKIIDSGIMINDASWNRLDRINLKNVSALLNKLGGVDKLVADGIISDATLWTAGKYNTSHVRSLLIKYGNRL